MKYVDRLFFATSSPLFVPEFCLNSFRLRHQEENNCSGLNMLPSGIDYVPRDILLAMQLINENCMRASELLGLRLCDNIRGNIFLIRGKKRSRSYTITVPGKWLLRPKRNDPRWAQPLFPFDYNYLYKWYCRTGIGGPRTGRKTNIRTHASRYVTAANVVALGTSDNASDALHHNSKRSINFYIHKKEPKNG
jgi:integrase